MALGPGTSRRCGLSESPVAAGYARKQKTVTTTVLRTGEFPKRSSPLTGEECLRAAGPDGLFRGGDPQFMTSLARGLGVLRAAASFKGPPTIADLSRATGLNRAVVRRCLYTLRELGYISSDGRRYFLQPGALNLGHALGYAYTSTAPLPNAARPLLEELSAELGEAASVAVLDGGAAVLVARAVAKRFASAGLRVGSRLAIHCSALGRVLLASLPEEQAGLELAKAVLVPYTRFTIVSRSRLAQVLAEVRSDGCALNDQELEIGLRSIAVPVRDPTGRVVAAMSVGAQASRVSRRQLIEDYLPFLKSASVRLGRQLTPEAL